MIRVRVLEDARSWNLNYDLKLKGLTGTVLKTDVEARPIMALVLFDNPSTDNRYGLIVRYSWVPLDYLQPLVGAQ